MPEEIPSFANLSRHYDLGRRGKVIAWNVQQSGRSIERPLAFDR